MPDYITVYLLTYLLHGAESFLRSWLVLQLVKKFPAFYGTRKFITLLTSARHLSLSITVYRKCILRESLATPAVKLSSFKYELFSRMCRRPVEIHDFFYLSYWQVLNPKHTMALSFSANITSSLQ